MIKNVLEISHSGIHRPCVASSGLWLGLCKLENEILKTAKNGQKWPKMIIFRPKNVIFERF